MKVVILFGILATHLYNNRFKHKLIMAGKELDASIIDPPREEEESEPGLKEELHKMKHKMTEMYQLPVGFKMPMFDLYDRHRDPVAHLRGFCSKMTRAGGKDELLMAYFSQSLSGAALEWYARQDNIRSYNWDNLAQAFARHFQYNVKIVPDRLSLTKIEKKPSESFREYGFRWREQAAHVYPPMEEDKMVEHFLQALEPTYLGHLILAIGKSFNKVVKIGGIVEEGLKSIKIISYSAIKATTHAIQNGTGGVLGKKKKEDVAMVVSGYWHDPTAHAETHMIEIVHKYGEPKKPSKFVMMIRFGKSKPVKTPNVTKAISLIVEGLTDKLSRPNDKPPVVVAKGLPGDDGTKQGKPKVVMRGIASKSVIIVEGARIAPVIIIPVTQLSIKNTMVVPWNYKRVIVTYKGKEVQHHQALMKILNEAHIPDKITVNHLEKIITKIFESNRITFSDNELLWRLKIDAERIHKNSICIQGFDGGGKDSIGDIVLELKIGPVEFTMEFQVLVVAVSYNLMLGRPWIHVAKAVMSSLHQILKFEWDRQEVIVHGDENFCAYKYTSVPFIKVEADKGPNF
ncbi:uncharacterized protein [Nicotiana sylvestris]|uniref:uncharacterized protein n=1 Tax=Nicotiana sylvestris TaxID=4096 RepID=UPI00388C8826